MPPDVLSNVVASATLADFTHQNLVIPKLRERDTAGVISELSHVLQRQACIPDLLPFYHAALNQELLSSSTLECGIAFPHARLSGVRQLRFAFGRAPEPVNWGTDKSRPVRLVFLLAVPATDAAAYLHLLACISRLGQLPDRLKELRAAEQSEAILSVLSGIRLRPGTGGA